MQDVDAGIDQLYQGDLGGFVTARNALAKTAKRPDLKALEKPSLSAWAVNQLFWHHRTAFEAVVHASEAVRRAHAQALAGAPADIRAAETAHRAAIREAVRVATSVLAGAGHPATGATLDAITRTLEALPSAEARGRLVKPLAPAGLEALAGLTVAAEAPAPAGPALRVVSTRPAGPATGGDAGAARARERARELAEAAARERQARREAAETALAAAESALAEADRAVAAAETALAERHRAREAARTALRQARRALDTI